MNRRWTKRRALLCAVLAAPLALVPAAVARAAEPLPQGQVLQTAAVMGPQLTLPAGPRLSPAAPN